MSVPGLTSAEAERRFREGGRNEVAHPKRMTLWSALVAQARDPLILVLLAACVLTLLTGDRTDAAVIAIVVAANSIVGGVQEIRADRAITALAQLNAPAVRVRRDGQDVSLPSTELVPGDVVLLGEGDIVPADGDLVEASSLLVDESGLTGESIPVAHRAPSLSAAGEELSAGTVVVKGRAVMQVTRVGARSALGRIAALLDTHPRATPLQRRLAGLGRVLAAVALGLSGVVLVAGLIRGEPLELMVVTAVSLAVAAVPESLPAVVTLALALGARRMAARNAVVRHLPAVETLGSVTVLATDKTGTLTDARMVVSELWTPSRIVTITGDGYEPRGVVLSGGAQLRPGSAPDVTDLLIAGALCNDAALHRPTAPGDRWKGMGDPTEVALLTAAGKFGLVREVLERDHPRLREVPFDSLTQQMTTVHAVPEGQGDALLVIVKGSPEALLARLADRRGSGGGEDALAAAEAFAARGFRVLAVASGSISRDGAPGSARLRLLGLVAIDDPPKAAALATIASCRAAGITPVLITGDHPATARAVAVAVGIIPPDGEHPGLVVTGRQMTGGSVPDLTVPRVFARTSPEQKLAIVQAWQGRGASVAMTGDGVNDGPALRDADVGVAMGHRGTEVARQAADVVLADDELATLVPAVEEGRRVYSNIRRFLVFGLSGGAAEIMVMLVGPFIGLTVPLLAAQILWINLLTHGLTGVAMGAEPSAPGAMRQPPRPPQQSVLGDGLWQRVIVLAAVIAAVTLGTGLWAQQTDRPWRSLMFLSLTALQLGVALGVRPRLLTRQNPILPLAIVCSALLALGGVFLPGLQALLETDPLQVSDAALALSTAAVGWAVARITRGFRGAPAPGASSIRAMAEEEVPAK